MAKKKVRSNGSCTESRTPFYPLAQDVGGIATGRGDLESLGARELAVSARRRRSMGPQKKRVHDGWLDLCGSTSEPCFQAAGRSFAAVKGTRIACMPKAVELVLCKRFFPFSPADSVHVSTARPCHRELRWPTACAFCAGMIRPLRAHRRLEGACCTLGPAGRAGPVRCDVAFRRLKRIHRAWAYAAGLALPVPVVAAPLGLELADLTHPCRAPGAGYVPEGSASGRHVHPIAALARAWQAHGVYPTPAAGPCIVESLRTLGTGHADKIGIRSALALPVVPSLALPDAARGALPVQILGAWPPLVLSHPTWGPAPQALVVVHVLTPPDLEEARPTPCAPGATVCKAFTGCPFIPVVSFWAATAWLAHPVVDLAARPCLPACACNARPRALGAYYIRFRALVTLVRHVVVFRTRGAAGPADCVVVVVTVGNQVPPIFAAPGAWHADPVPIACAVSPLVRAALARPPAWFAFAFRGEEGAFCTRLATPLADRIAACCTLLYDLLGALRAREARPVTALRWVARSLLPFVASAAWCTAGLADRVLQCALPCNKEAIRAGRAGRADPVRRATARDRFVLVVAALRVAPHAYAVQGPTTLGLEVALVAVMLCAPDARGVLRNVTSPITSRREEALPTEHCGTRLAPSILPGSALLPEVECWARPWEGCTQRAGCIPQRGAWGGDVPARPTRGAIAAPPPDLQIVVTHGADVLPMQALAPTGKVFLCTAMVVYQPIPLAPHQVKVLWTVLCSALACLALLTKVRALHGIQSTADAGRIVANGGGCACYGHEIVGASIRGDSTGEARRDVRTVVARRTDLHGDRGQTALRLLYVIITIQAAHKHPTHTTYVYVFHVNRSGPLIFTIRGYRRVG